MDSSAFLHRVTINFVHIFKSIAGFVVAALYLKQGIHSGLFRTCTRDSSRVTRNHHTFVRVRA